METSQIIVGLFCYFGGFAFAAICVICAIVRLFKRKSSKLFWIAAILLALSQIVVWAIALETGNAI
jgi:hypothetical protein